MSWAKIAWEGYKDIEAAYHAGKEVIDEINNITGNLKGKKSTKRKFVGDSTRKFKRTKSTPQSQEKAKIHRSINVSESFRNMPSQAGGTASTEDEIPVIPVPRNLAKSHPDYFSIDLPFYFNHTLVLSQGVNIAKYSINLNSVYDVIRNGTGDRTLHQPLGRDSWANIYDYYRVVSSDINLDFNYAKGEFGENRVTAGAPVNDSIPKHVMVGYEITENASDGAATTTAWIEEKHSKAVPLHPFHDIPTNYTLSTEIASTKVVRSYAYGGKQAMSFHYAPENWDYHVMETGLAERWTPKENSPAFPHLMNICVGYPDYNGLDLDDKIYINLDCYCTFTVQWREVNSVKKRTIDTTQ